MENSVKMSTTSNQKKVLSSSMLGLGTQSMSTMLLSFVLTTMIAEFGLSGAAGGFISTITNLGMLVGGIIFGGMADRQGRKNVFMITVLIYSVATGLIALSSNMFMVYSLRFLVGVGGGGVYGVIMSLVADSFEQKTRGRVTS